MKMGKQTCLAELSLPAICEGSELDVLTISLDVQHCSVPTEGLRFL